MDEQSFKKDSVSYDPFWREGYIAWERERVSSFLLFLQALYFASIKG